MKTFEEITVGIPAFGEFMFHVDTEFNAVRMYRWADELAENVQELEWLDDEDEQDMSNPRNYRPGRNALFMHARSPAMVRRLWAYVSEWDLIPEAEPGRTPG